MTVKVSKSRLIAAITAERQRVIAQHSAQVKESSQKFGEYRKATLIVISSFMSELRGAKNCDDITTELQYGRNLKLPEMPSPASEPNTKKYDRALAQLALAEDDTITLNENRDGDFLALISA